MVSVFDVAAYILEKQGEMTAMKLQKLCYYAQAWSLVWDEEALFCEPIKAWANGPVIPALYGAHKGMFRVNRQSLPVGVPDRLNAAQRDSVDAVLKFYGPMTSQELSELTHCEDPWKNARRNLPPGARGRREITPAELAEYYGGL